MTRRWRITWQIFILQVLLGVFVVGGGFAGAISEEFIFEKYFLIYEPLMFFAKGAGFMAVFFVLPLAMFVYSYLIGGLISEFVPVDAC